MKRQLAIGGALLALGAGSAGAAAIHRLALHAGESRRIGRTVVTCLPKVVTQTTTVTVTTAQPAAPAPAAGPLHVSGSGDRKLPAFTVAGGATLRWEHHGPGTFRLSGRGGSGGSSVAVDQASSGESRGQVRLGPGTYDFEVTASGPWEVTLTRG